MKHIETLERVVAGTLYFEQQMNFLRVLNEAVGGNYGLDIFDNDNLNIEQLKSIFYIINRYGSVLKEQNDEIKEQRREQKNAQQKAERDKRAREMRELGVIP